MPRSSVESASPPMVSVVMPVYNAAPFLDQALESVRSQTLKDIEIICVDDGSTDGSDRILERHRAQDHRLKVLRQSNQGAGSARNKGLNEATGKFIWFPDADDFYEPQLLSCSVDALVAKETDFVCVRCDFFENKTSTFTPFPESIRTHLLPTSTCSFTYEDAVKDCLSIFSGWAWDKVYRREFILKSTLAFDELPSSNDLRFVIGATLRASSIAVVEEVLAHHRTGIKTSVSNTREHNYSSSFVAIKGIKRDLVSWGVYNKLENDFKNFSIYFLLWHLDHLRWPAYKSYLNQLRRNWVPELNLHIMTKKDFHEEKLFHEFRTVLSFPSYLLKARSSYRRVWAQRLRKKSFI